VLSYPFFEIVSTTDIEGTVDTFKDIGIKHIESHFASLMYSGPKTLGTISLRHFIPQRLLLFYILVPKALMSTKCEEGLRDLDSNQDKRIQSPLSYH
jgi:hypothetical protein